MNIILSGDPQGEHLKAQVRPDGIHFYSHEMSITKVDGNWRDRYFFPLEYDDVEQLYKYRQEARAAL